jgi:hypothetical protein
VPISINIETEEDAKRALDALAQGNYSDELKQKIKDNIYRQFGDLDE